MKICFLAGFFTLSLSAFATENIPRTYVRSASPRANDLAYKLYRVITEHDRDGIEILIEEGANPLWKTPGEDCSLLDYAIRLFEKDRKNEDVLPLDLESREIIVSILQSSADAQPVTVKRNETSSNDRPAFAWSIELIDFTKSEAGSGSISSYNSPEDRSVQDASQVFVPSGV